MISIDHYVQGLIKEIPSYSISSDDKKKIRFDGLASLVYEKLTASKFKSSSNAK